MFYFTINIVDLQVLCYICNFFLFTNKTPISYFYVNLFVLSFIYKSYVFSTQFMFYFTLNVDLQILCYICKFLFCLSIMHKFTTSMLIYSFYLSFVSIMFHLYNLCLFYI